MRRSIRLTPYDEEPDRAFEPREFDEDAGDADSGAYGSPPSRTIGHYAAPDNRMPIFLAGDNEPTYDEPTYDEPIYDERGYDEPAYNEPMDDEPPMRRGFGSGRELQHRPALWPRILKAGIFASVAAGIALAIASMDNPLALFTNAKASLAGQSPDPSSAAPPVAPPAPTVQLATRVQASPPSASVRLTRDEIAAALRGSPQGTAQQVQPEIPQPKVAAIPPPKAAEFSQPRAVEIPSNTAVIPQSNAAVIPQSNAAAIPPPKAVAPPAMRLAADELANLMKRAKALIAVGDISPARLLLERAADAQEASAALLLAQTYDPAVLGTQDQRSITADPAMARAWYQKAAQLGSPEALGRLAQIQN